MKYAVLEWEKESEDDYCLVVATNQEKHVAEVLVKISPEHMEREMVTMKEYQLLREQELN